MQQDTAVIFMMLVIGLVAAGQVSANSEKGSEATERFDGSSQHCSDKERHSTVQKNYTPRGLPGKVPAQQVPAKMSAKIT